MLPIPRRTLLGMVAGGLLAVPHTALGQEAREAKIGLLTERTLPPPFIDALRRGLTEAGWVEGRSFRIEQRSAVGDLERLPALAAELIGSGVTVIVTGVGSPAALAAKRATATIPIVFVTGGDPVDFGIVANRLKPGANVTGLFPDGGGLMSFSVDLVALCRRAAGHVDRILRGAHAGDLSVEEAVKFDLVINVAAANALGLKIPASLRERAELIP